MHVIGRQRLIFKSFRGKLEVDRTPFESEVHHERQHLSSLEVHPGWRRNRSIGILHAIDELSEPLHHIVAGIGRNWDAGSRDGDLRLWAVGLSEASAWEELGSF